ncbi:MAG: hypothetical protein KatS3mg050_4251 [Litorilinea sp.]|nr:MAG: hypothetical protein KatS3mg050_4251 [Litorilinea sp.]
MADTHLDLERLLVHIFDHDPWTPQEAEHLAACPSCRAQVDALRRLHEELEVARRSQPSPTALRRYQQLFQQVQTGGQSAPSWWQWLRARLAWDSRQQPALAGVRGAAGGSYRLLYTTPRVEVELLVTPTGARRQIDGDILAEPGPDPITPALIELVDASDLPALAVESDQEGRFRLVEVPTGRYRLTITPPAGAPIQIDELDIT